MCNFLTGGKGLTKTTFSQVQENPHLPLLCPGRQFMKLKLLLVGINYDSNPLYFCSLKGYPRLHKLVPFYMSTPGSKLETKSCLHREFVVCCRRQHICSSMAELYLQIYVFIAITLQVNFQASWVCTHFRKENSGILYYLTGWCRKCLIGCFSCVWQNWQPRPFLCLSHCSKRGKIENM